MKFDKIQAEFLKLAYSNNIKYQLNYKLGEDWVAVIHPHYLAVIPKSEYFLNTERVFNEKPPMNLKFDLFTDNTKPCRDTGITCKCENGRLHKFSAEDGTSVYVDEKYLKLFTPEKSDEIHYTCKTLKVR